MTTYTNTSTAANTIMTIEEFLILLLISQTVFLSCVFLAANI